MPAVVARMLYVTVRAPPVVFVNVCKGRLPLPEAVAPLMPAGALDVQL